MVLSMHVCLIYIVNMKRGLQRELWIVHEERAWSSLRLEDLVLMECSLWLGLKCVPQSGSRYRSCRQGEGSQSSTQQRRWSAVACSGGIAGCDGEGDWDWDWHTRQNHGGCVNCVPSDVWVHISGFHTVLKTHQLYLCEHTLLRYFKDPLWLSLI